MTTNLLINGDEDSNDPAFAGNESLDEGGTWLLDLVAAVDHLRRGHRPGLTVWDALDDALRAVTGHTDWDAPDPLATSLQQFLTNDPHTTAAAGLQIAVRHWVTTNANHYNNGHHWPHPQTRRGFPAPSLTALSNSDQK